MPRLATDGERLTKPLEVQILRSAVPDGRPSPAPAENLDIWKSIAPADVEKQIHGGRLALTLDLAAIERGTPRPLTFRFGVRTLTRGFRRRPSVSAISNLVEIPVLEPPEPPQGLQAVTTERAIELTWAAPSRMASAYRVYRSSTVRPDSFLLIGEAHGPHYSDNAFEFGRTYFYKVTAAVKEGSTVATSEDSQVVEITPRDVFPPAAPQGLTALYTAAAVELIWQASSEPDLGGYNVYRREEGGREAKLNTEPLETPIFRDAAVTGGRKYFYRVTAQDATGNEGTASEEVAAEAR